MQAMILAAGLGTRLRPFTEMKPKPIFPVLGQPLLLVTIEKLQQSGFNKIIVNCHHLAEQIIDLISGISGVIVQHEEIILGTGGGLRRALPKLDDEPLLVVNGDIYHSLDYQQLYTFHAESRKQVTMALHDCQRFNKVAVQGDMVIDIGGESAKQLAFTGIQVLDPQILLDIKEDCFSCIIARYKSFLAAKGTIGVYRADDCFWADMGTVPDYLQLHGDLFKRDERLRAEQVVAGENTVLPADVCIKDWVSLGSNVKIGENVHLERSVVWDNAILENNRKYVDTIVV